MYQEPKWNEKEKLQVEQINKKWEKILIQINFVWLEEWVQIPEKKINLYF